MKLKFPSIDHLNAALSTELTVPLAVHHAGRNAVSFDLADGNELASIQIEALEREYGATAVEDYRYDLEDTDLFDPLNFGPDTAEAPSLDDVLEEIGARSAWAQSRGRNVIIAIVDTGIDGTRPEFPAWKRVSQSWAPIGDDPWQDWQGHGTMCACIATATRAEGGQFDGVAPDARLMSCKTRFYDLELAAIYDELTTLARAGNVVIASNSFGSKTGTPPPEPADSDFLPALDDAIEAGVMPFFSAGNYHDIAGGDPHAHEPNSIWLHKGRHDVFTVGACDERMAMWYYSSRGLGQFYPSPGTSAKPDAVGMTPANGRILFGSDVRTMPVGWGTSGCCPQAAGLAALIMSRSAPLDRPTLSRQELFAHICSTAKSLGHHPASQGAGLIQCP
ncbi:hypothetical protein NX02_00635 [Sphingomonas sanxanigenens DSM 19645 = NX02]|uniref:Peptidase S8/S53 domain-containing protein n=2 Tax=Sphingomonas sanxanigenens TaxID=397260 RepID=W0A1T0_9SPHN|nr:hypothetical protein NX02_00635 [Sphingomonas sanxanigenens DSM 19645 = NX02]